jgi:hypothetical protein
VVARTLIVACRYSMLFHRFRPYWDGGGWREAAAWTATRGITAPAPKKATRAAGMGEDARCAFTGHGGGALSQSIPPPATAVGRATLLRRRRMAGGGGVDGGARPHSPRAQEGGYSCCGSNNSTRQLTGKR